MLLLLPATKTGIDWEQQHSVEVQDTMGKVQSQG